MAGSNLWHGLDPFTQSTMTMGRGPACISWTDEQNLITDTVAVQWLVRGLAIKLHIITLLYSEVGAEGDIKGSGQSIGRTHGSTNTCPSSGQ